MVTSEQKILSSMLNMVTSEQKILSSMLDKDSSEQKIHSSIQNMCLPAQNKYSSEQIIVISVPIICSSEVKILLPKRRKGLPKQKYSKIAHFPHTADKSALSRFLSLTIQGVTLCLHSLMKSFKKETLSLR